MNVLIRTDASKKIGSGHVMRCLTLADGLRMRGAQIKFSCIRHEGHLCDLISERGYEVISAIENTGASDLLIVDHYELDENWETSQRPFCKRIFVIDDLARSHDCDILLDQNLVADFKTRYTGKVLANCKLLLGPEYALLPPIYAELHN
ncbi:MAG: UDP-2,4-diacetamido-2,4,6-trideoxy-beta-L-altropyranose hydrolase, partial [Myxococcaceae bacterium]